MGDPAPSQHHEVPAIPDVRSLSLEFVLGTEDSALDNAVRQVVGDVRRPAEQYAAHGTSVVS